MLKLEKNEKMKLRDVLDYVKDGTYNSPIELEEANKKNVIEIEGGLFHPLTF